MLAENIIFIVLNLIFLTILILFLFSRMGSGAVLEEKYSKQIALVLDSAKPGMMIHINMEDAIEEAKKELGEDKIGGLVVINGNIVTVRLGEGLGYSYSFFNDVDATAYLDKTDNKRYVFIIDE
ncbi:unnamed protein product [marine sediment metagenome]|uniref:Uncharacterized protein n=1 Tax=marine sediment metagenome TaxID=412755 RepID=X0V856_9ZZZZ